MERPLVSICIPTYNSSKYILETVESVLNQTWSNLEVLVVDDCSSDKTLELLKTVTDPRFRLIENEHNLGMTGNWNKCVRECRGEYVKLIPADDILYPECLSKSVPILDKHQDITLVCVGTDLINDEGKITGHYMHWPKEGVFDGKKIAKASAMWNDFFGNPVSLLFRKSDFEKVGGFDETIPYILDFDICMGLAGRGKVFFRKECLTAFRVRKDSNTGKLTKSGGKDYTAEHIRLIDKHRSNGNIAMNAFERAVSIAWRWTRNWIIAFFVSISNR